MVQIIQRPPSFGEKFAAGLGQGFQQGISNVFEHHQKKKMEEAKAQQAQKFYNDIMAKGKETSEAAKGESSTSSSGVPSSGDGTSQPSETEIKKQKASALMMSPYEGVQKVGQQLYQDAVQQEKSLEKRRMAQEEREFLPKKEYIQHQSKSTTDFLDKIQNIERKKSDSALALATMEDSLGNATKWAAAKDLLADKSGYEGFRSSSGAELNSAVKQYLVADLESITGRPNMFIEQQLRDAYPKSGIDPISNQKMLLGLRMRDQINDLKIRKTRELEEHYIDKQGFLPPGFEAKVNKGIKKEVEDAEKNAIKTLHHLSDIQEDRDKYYRKFLHPGEVLMMDPQGNPFAVKKKEVRAYKDKGFLFLGEK